MQKSLNVNYATPKGIILSYYYTNMIFSQKP